jgi:fatty aldehyde-generating acyl-ACP reductase
MRVREPDRPFDLNLPRGTLLACMSETAILALCDRRESYTLGRGIDLAKVREIEDLAADCGFALADMRAFDTAITREKIAAVRAAAAQRRNLAS